MIFLLLWLAFWRVKQNTSMGCCTFQHMLQTRESQYFFPFSTEYILQQVAFLQPCGSRSRSACAISPTGFTRTNHLHRRTGIQIGTPKDKSLLENTGVTDCILFNKTKLVALQRNRGFFFNKKEKGMAMTQVNRKQIKSFYKQTVCRTETKLT